MSQSPYRPADDATEQRWEFIWWGFGDKARHEREMSVDGPIHRRWRLGPCEIRIYLEARKPPRRHPGGDEERPLRQIRGPGDGPNDANG